MSMPFIKKPFTFTQPDGTVLNLLGTGNQHAARFETEDGLAVVRDSATGFFHPVAGAAKLAAAGSPAAGTLTAGLPRAPSRWQLRREKHRAGLTGAGMLAAAPPRRQTVGRFVGLTLLIDFEDHPATIAKAEVEAYCNRPGYSGFGNQGSVRDYFLDVSGGRLDYSNLVAPYYRARRPRSYYTDPAVTYPKRAQELIREALASLIAGGFDPAPLTADPNRCIYALNVFYAGTNGNEWCKGLWPHQATLSPMVPLGRRKKVADYQITDMGAELTLGTFCHENGHMICDFPDLYDYDSGAGASNGAGKFCLMCFGGSEPREKNPVQIGAYLKQAAGWASRLTTAQRGPVTLAAGQNDFAIHRKSRTEYYLIENRAASGRDAALGANGLAVWHVDETGNNSFEAGTPAQHYECALVQADGRRDLERRSNVGDDQDLFKAGHNAALSDSSTPNCKWWDGSNSALSIRNIGPAGPTMTFEVV